jgi:hypothetical protein
VAPARGVASARLPSADNESAAPEERRTPRANHRHAALMGMPAAGMDIAFSTPVRGQVLGVIPHRAFQVAARLNQE